MIGKQNEGTSHFSIKQMAEKALASLVLPKGFRLADIGAGKGASSEWLWPQAGKVMLVDYAAQLHELPNNTKYLSCDLNENWPLDSGSLDLLISLEVIEHLENPRHFFREMFRMLTPGGYAFVSTPHNLNLMARLVFLFKGQHRHFQDYSYPAHITALLPIDIKRIAKETGFRLLSTHYNYLDVLPLFGKEIHLKHACFSNSIGFLLQKI
jgi:2-polyprenyl-3-methyl-5-hydroxy-6-metoxy-1,4-benzoquinol methylase